MVRLYPNSMYVLLSTFTRFTLYVHPHAIVLSIKVHPSKDIQVITMKFIVYLIYSDIAQKKITC